MILSAPVRSPEEAACSASLGPLIATGLTRLLRPQRGRFELRRLPGALLALGRHLFIVAFAATRRCLVAALLVVDAALSVKRGIIAIPLACDSEFTTVRSDYASTLAAREMVVEIDESNVMYTCALDATPAAEYMADAQHLHGSWRRSFFPQAGRQNPWQRF